MDEHTNKKVKEFVAKKQSVLIYADEVKKLHQKGGSAQRIIIATNNYLYVCAVNKVKEKHAYPWYSITSMKIEGTTISMQFSPNIVFRFISNIAQKLFELFAFHLRKILAEDEYIRLNLNIDKKMPRPTGASVVWRLQYFLHNSPQKIPIRDLNSFIRNVVKSSAFFDMSLLPSIPAAYIAVLQAVRLRYNVKCLCARKLRGTQDFDVVQLFADNFDFSSVEYLQFNEIDPDSPSFSNFIHSLKESKNCTLCGLGFAGVKFSLKSYQLLIDTMRAKKIGSLTLDQCLQKEDLKKIFSLESFQNINYLSIENNPIFNTQTLIQNVSNLEALSIANCGKTLGEVFDLIKTNNLPNLKALDISSNYGSNLKDKDYVLPQKLSRIKADNIEWYGPDLVAFLSLITKTKRNFHLSIADMKISASDYQDLGRFLINNSFPTLKTLCWDKNKVSQELFNTFSRSGHIEHLSITGCIDDNSISALSNFLRDNTTLKTLIMRGTDSKRIKNFKPFCEVIETCTDFRFLDISKQELNSSQGNQIVMNLAKCPRLEGFAMDSTRIENCQQLELILSQLLPLKRQIFVSLPFNDLARLSDDPRKLAVRDTIRKLALQVNLPDWPFDPLINSFYYKSPYYFPYYIGPTTLKEQEDDDENSEGFDLNASLPRIILTKDERVLRTEALFDNALPKSDAYSDLPSEIPEPSELSASKKPVKKQQQKPRSASKPPQKKLVREYSESSEEERIVLQRRPQSKDKNKTDSDSEFNNNDFKNQQSMSIIDDIVMSTIIDVPKPRNTKSNIRRNQNQRITLQDQQTRREPRDIKKYNQQKQAYRKADWSFPINYVPAIESKDLIEETAYEYSLVNIVKDLRGK